MIKISFLAENKTDNPECMAEHGLSIYIEVNDKKILFDTGASDLCIKNSEILGINLKDVGFVVISHGHYDHTQGLPTFTKINDKAQIYIHKDAFKEFYGMENGTIDTESCGILWNETEKAKILDRSILTDGVLNITEDIIISGTVPNIEGVVPTEKFFIKQLNSEVYIEDDLKHEQFLAIRDRDANGESRGIYLFSGCSHKGVIPVIRYAEKLFPNEKILGLIAGMHLYNADKEIRSKTINEILESNIEMVMPVHCTGIKAICELKAIMEDRCIVATSGDSYNFPINILGGGKNE